MAPTLSPLAQLRQEIALRGWHRKATGRVVFELCIHVALTIGGIALFVATGRLPVRAAGLWLATLGTMGVATNSHTSSHYATSNKAWVNELLSYFGTRSS